MTNELGTTLNDIEAKAERKREALEFLSCVDDMARNTCIPDGRQIIWSQGTTLKPHLTIAHLKAIRKYIEEN